MIEEMRPFTRRAVSVLVCQIGTFIPSTSAVVISHTRLRPILGNTYRSSDERQPFADAKPPPVRRVGSYSRNTLSAACSNVGPPRPVARSLSWSAARPLCQRPSHSRSSGGIVSRRSVDRGMRSRAKPCDRRCPRRCRQSSEPRRHHHHTIRDEKGPSPIGPSFAARLRPPTTARSPVATRVHRSSRSSSNRPIADKAVSVALGRRCGVKADTMSVSKARRLSRTGDDSSVPSHSDESSVAHATARLCMINSPYVAYRNVPR